MGGNKKIIINTLINYVRLGSVILLSIFGTRYVLMALGEVDYGIYNLIAGTVLLFAFISGVLSAATQRFISIAVGQNKSLTDISELIYSFLLLHFAIAILLACIIQVGGSLIIRYLLSIPADRISDAYLVLTTVTLGLIVTVVCAPFEAVLIARENILVLSLTQLFISTLQFSVAIIVLHADVDHLRLYAVLVAFLPVIKMLIVWMYCRRHYPETRIKLKWIKDFKPIRDMGAYVGWILIGGGCGTIRQQGIGIILNIFYGVIINAANGIAMQVNSVILQYSSSIGFSLRPQLIQSVGSQDSKRFLELTFASCKFSLLMTGLVTVPLIVTMPHILSIWLVEVPSYTVSFCRILLISALVMNASIGLTTALEAIGKVKMLHLTVGICHLIPVIAGYILLRQGYSPTCPYWLIVGVEVYATFMRLLFVRHYINFQSTKYVTDILLRAGGTILLYYIIISFIHHTLQSSQGVANVFVFFLTSGLIYIILTYFIALNHSQRTMIKEKCYKLVTHGNA